MTIAARCQRAARMTAAIATTEDFAAASLIANRSADGDDE
jgi:hypothetical protein